MSIQFVLGLLLLCAAWGSLCGRERCNSCVSAQEYVKHWSGGTVLTNNDK